MYKINMINNENFYNCKLSDVQLTLIIIISIFTVGFGWFVFYPLFKTAAFYRDINSQIQIQEQILQEINDLQNQIKKIEENIYFLERKDKI
ncbi:hypothetical protein ATP_00149 [Candidatus Phytoplasma mali]|uniref:Uncharacterized protein n=1 Tax=Phytoplasma mali (strain AT) TaxID=482235 RepID=B3R0H2_PHYMT|nr:hypothetical protein [Candidatus Phytoplasma mali]CAP18336.1 hypothetical protein ATP_00149 [Candidatus Phytoplasma mali]